MSWDGVTIGLPSFGPRMLLLASIKCKASSCAALLNGTWTAIWSPSKSALKPVQTSGCKRMARPSTKIGWKAWIPSLCNVGARFNKTGCLLMISSTISKTTSSYLSIILSACLCALATPLFKSSQAINGLNN